MEINNITDIEQKIGNLGSTDKEKAIKLLDEIIYFLPDAERNLIEEAFQYQRIPKEYLLSSILFAYSNAAGLAFSIQAMGYKNYANLYFALVGSRGDIKSPAMELATAPLNEYDNKKYKEFLEETNNAEPEEKIKRTQLFLQDATIEAAYLHHFNNPYSSGIWMDEIYHLIEKMGNPNSRDGSAWRTYLLQGNTNKHIDITRKTTESFRINKSYPVLLGSIQSEFIPKIFSGGNLESGLVDRMLLTVKLTHNNKLSKEGIPQATMQKYADNLLNLMEYRKAVEGTEYTGDQFDINCSKEAEERIFTYSQELILKQESIQTIEKEYISKMLINIHKLALLLHLIKSSEHSEFQEEISKTTVEHAISLMEFYFLNYKLILKQKDKSFKSIDKQEVIKIGLQNGATQQEMANVLGMNKSSISRHIKKHNLQPATS